MARFPVYFGPLLCLVVCLVTLAVSSEHAAAQPLKIAVAVSRTGFGATAGRPAAMAAQLAVDEANAAGGPPVALLTYDDLSTADGARRAANQAAADGALVVVGPVISVLSLAAGPLYAQHGLASIAATAHADQVTSNATTFQPVFSTSEMGAALAAYIRYVLDARSAVVVFQDNGYGRPMRDGFLATAARFGLTATAWAVLSPADRDAIAAERAADLSNAPIVLAMIDNDAKPLLLTLRRHGVRAPIFGSSATASNAFAALFANEPEMQRDPGFFTDGVYAIAPSILDSANAQTLAVDASYRARFGTELQWEAVQAYDSTRLAIDAAGAAADLGHSDIATLRAGVLAYLVGLDGPEHAIGSLTGPLWFTPDRGRQQASRVGRFHGAQFESAPVQLVPVETTTANERASGAIFEVAPGQFARRQLAVYTGIYLNEVSRIDIASSTFTADFYLWLRYSAAGVGAIAADPADLDFPDLVRGSFDPKRPAARGDLDDGTTYRLWRIRGEFKNDFDLHHYPFDRQSLVARLFNARAASDQIVYIQDRRSIGTGVVSFGNTDEQHMASASAAPAVSTSSQPPVGGAVDTRAFRNLTQ